MADRVSGDGEEGRARPARDAEGNRLGRRLQRYAQVGGGMSGVAARLVGNRLFGDKLNESTARELREALGGMKGPIMKIAQLLSSIPEAVPKEFAEELSQLQSSAPPMGWPFVKRRMRAELGADWQSHFRSFERDAAFAASLGQVHRAVAPDGREVVSKLQYPDMQSAVEADLRQLRVLLQIFRRVDSAIDTREIYQELSERLREELDYEREAAHMRLYDLIFGADPRIIVPEPVPELSTKRLLTMTRLDGEPILSFRDHPLEDRNEIARSMFAAWWHPFARYGVIHGDPHLGNYTVRTHDDVPAKGGANKSGGWAINLLDYGCIRIFPPAFVAGVIELYHAIATEDRDRAAAAYDRWGFTGLDNEMIDTLNIWAKFIYGPLLDDRVRSIADGVSPAEYGRKEAYRVHQALKELGPVTPPREFVFMDRAAIGLGAVFLHLDAELNFHEMFMEAIEGFDATALEARQREALDAAGVPA